ncbi:uncharacterized protein Pkcdelta isoform X1 [Eurosta solidaginis]|uniref:uncharacterized protein Pkcdelta isoform X1 n=1 Tax=Eurosta solidaginis TaxID=178769 RepID=UPI003530AB35
MPLYTDQSYYYSGSGSSPLYAPYYTPGYATPTSSAGGSYAPYTSTYNRSIGGSYILPLAPPRSPSYTSAHSISSRYQPKLSTITETSPHISTRHGGIIPLTRIQSPKVISYATPSTPAPRYIPPRPIPINTADIDVSSSKYKHHKHEEEKEMEKEVQQYSEAKRGSIHKKDSDCGKSEDIVKAHESRGRCSTIKRNRPVVRLSTIRSRSKDRNRAAKSTASGTDESSELVAKVFKDLPTVEALQGTETHLSWREKLAQEFGTIPTHTVKKSPGDLMRERYLIQNDARSDNIVLAPNLGAIIKADDTPKAQLIDDVVIELDLDQTNKAVRHLSIPQCPSFHDICQDISSDKIDDDLNAGELRRRASLIQEQEQEILNQLQKSASGTFQLIHLERHDSEQSTANDAHQQSTNKRKSKKGKKVRHKITAVVEVENSPILPVLQEKEELALTPAGKESYPKPKFSFNVDSVEEHHEVHKVLQLPKRKSVKKIMKSAEKALPEGFMEASPKSKMVSKPKVPKTFVNTAEIFTFEPSNIKLMTEVENTDELEVETSSKKMGSSVPEIDLIFGAESQMSKPVTAYNMEEEKALETTVPKKTSEKSKSLTPPKDDSFKSLLSPKVKSESPKSNIKSKPPHKNPTLAKSNIAVDSKAVSFISQEPKQQFVPSEVSFQAVKSLSNENKPTARSKLQEIKQNYIEKSDSGEDFWAQIGNRESVYMTNRKKGQLENQWHKREVLLDSPAVENVSNIKEIKSSVKAQKKEVLKKADLDLAKGVEKSASTKSQSTESTKLKKDKTIENQLEHAPKIGQEATVKKSLGETPKSFIGTIENAATTTTPKVCIPADNTNVTSATAKINFGQKAKSPEKQLNTFSMPADSNNENKINTEKPKLFISQTTTTSTIAFTPTTTTPKTPNTPKPINETANNKTTETQLTDAINSNADAKTKPEIKALKQTDTNIKSDTSDIKNTDAKTPPTSHKTPTTFTQSDVGTIITGAKPKTMPKSTKTTPTKVLSNASAPTTVGKSKTSPRNTTLTAPNADEFISVAPPKSATSPTKTKITSPQGTKTKLKQSTTAGGTTVNNNANGKIVKTKVTSKAATAAKVELKVSVPAPSTPTTTTVTCADAITTATTTTTKIPVATSTTVPASPIAANLKEAVAKESLEQHYKNHEDANGEDGEKNQNEEAHAPNNLSKFATVQNLAQCLQDVDADLEEFIPSSAENSDDEDSSYDYSSTDDCDYKDLSASMKKKVKQQRKKEKQAEKARFDPQKKIKIDPSNKCYVKEEAPRFPLVATPRPLWKREKIVYPVEESDDESGDSEGSGSGSEETEDSEECTTSEEYDDDLNANANAVATGSNVSKENSAIIRLSTCSNDSGFEGGTAPSSPKKMLETSYTYSQFQKSGRFTAPATVIPRFKNYSVDDFHFLAVLGKGSFGKVLLAELRDTTYYYAVKCLKKDVVLEDDDVDSTLIERKVLALGTKHPYLCHLFCTFQTESHLFFVMEYLNGGDLMFHIQESGRFPEERARFYGAEIISGLKFLHKKGIIYRDLKLDNVLLDYEGHVRIADFGMCKLQIYLDKTADSFCGTPDYMAPEIIKGEKYNQNVDWWSFGVLLYEMLIGQSPFSGCDEDELFWSICNEIPWFPVYISAEATGILRGLLEKDYTKRIGSQYSPAGDISDHIFFRPIDWNLLEKRELPPPFKPLVKHPLDTQYFDRVFTKERVRLTPIERDILQSMDQKPFLGFTYTNPHITLDD